MPGCVLMSDMGPVKGEVLVLARIISRPPMAVCVNSYPAGAHCSRPLQSPGQGLAMPVLSHHEGIFPTG